MGAERRVRSIDYLSWKRACDCALGSIAAHNKRNRARDLSCELLGCCRTDRQRLNHPYC